MGEMVSYPSNGGTSEGYLALPRTGAGPAVIVIQEWWGLVPHVKGLADRFARPRRHLGHTHDGHVSARELTTRGGGTSAAIPLP